MRVGLLIDLCTVQEEDEEGITGGAPINTLLFTVLLIYCYYMLVCLYILHVLYQYCLAKAYDTTASP